MGSRGNVSFTALASFIFHSFRAAPADPVQNAMIHFMKNTSILGALLNVVVHGTGVLSVDRGEPGR